MNMIPPLRITKAGSRLCERTPRVNISQRTARTLCVLTHDHAANDILVVKKFLDIHG